MRCVHCHRQITVNFTSYLLLLLLLLDSLQLSILAEYSVSHLSSFPQLREATPFREHVLFPTRLTPGRIQLYPVYLGISSSSSSNGSRSSATVAAATASIITIIIIIIIIITIIITTIIVLQFIYILPTKARTKPWF